MYASLAVSSRHDKPSVGISLSALGILCTVSIPMSNMGYDAISASAGGLSALAKMDRTTQNRIRDLDALGNTAACVSMRVP